MGSEASPLIRIARRVLVEWLSWLPIWLILTSAYQLSGKLLLVCAGTVLFILGLFLYQRLSPAWSRATLILSIALLLGIGIPLFSSEWMTLVWLAVLLWRGRYPKLGARHYGYAFLLCCVAVIIVAQNASLPDYRMIIIALSLLWIVVWFLSVNRGLLEEAGLNNQIVTRPVRRANLLYLLIFLTGALLVFALTVNYGKELLTPPKYVPSEEVRVDIEDVLPPPSGPTGLGDMLGAVEKQGPRSVIWDILFWVLTGAAAVGLVWFVRMLWRDRTWSWRSFADSIRAWFVREKKAEALPYIEERRSLLKDKKKGPGRWNAFFHRNHREREWEQLDNPQKVRRLYEEAVLAGIEQGYEFHAHHSSAETLTRIAQWRANHSLPDKDNSSTYWNRLLNIRLKLMILYEKARYSPHSVTDQEAEDLKAHLHNK
jgi:hypothetical protein